MSEFIFNFAEGLRNLMSQPTLYVFKNFGMGVLEGLETGSFPTTTAKDNHLLYGSAAAMLGENVFLNSQIIAVDRSGNDSVLVRAKTPIGQVLFQSQKLIFTIPPKLSNLDGWDLSASESTLFQQFGNSAYYTSIVRNMGLPENSSSVTNVGADTKNKVPVLPGIYSIRQT